jgi:hypothetical protein
MGWSNGNSIFDTVCDEVIRQVNTNTGIWQSDAEKLLSVLIDELQNHDWDTEHESLDKYKDVGYVVRAFADNYVTFDPEIEDAELEGDLL